MDNSFGKRVTVYCPPGSTSKVIGQRKRNKLNLEKIYNLKCLKVVEKSDIIGYNIELDIL